MQFKNSRWRPTYIVANQIVKKTDRREVERREGKKKGRGRREGIGVSEANPICASRIDYIKQASMQTERYGRTEVNRKDTNKTIVA